MDSLLDRLNERTNQPWRSEKELRDNLLFAEALDKIDFLMNLHDDMANDINDLRDALGEAVNALADYIPQLEATGSSLFHGRKVLEDARAALIGSKENAE